jgi:hypothetical protein
LVMMDEYAAIHHVDMDHNEEVYADEMEEL